MRALLVGELEVSSPTPREWAAIADMLYAALSPQAAAEHVAEEEESRWLQLLRDAAHRRREPSPED